MNILDLTYLHTATDNNKELESELATIFRDQLDEFESELETTYKDRDWQKLAAIAHKAKSSIVAMGMNELGIAMKRLEMMSKQIYVEEHIHDCEDKKSKEFAIQLESIPDNLKKWILENKSEKVAQKLIFFYKLQAEMARKDLDEAYPISI